MSNEHIARAIVYAARQAFMINAYGMTWEAIETNTANILAGCSVPADGKMNSAEAVSNSIMGRLRTQADTPDINELARAMQVDRLMSERDEALRERDKALEAMRIEATAAQEARKEALANRLDRDQFAAKWATLKGECHAQNQRANQAEKDNAELLRLLDAVRADLAGSELCRDQLRRDRDGFRNGSQFWMDSAKAACLKVVKLRTVLQNAISDPFNASLNTINHVLDETK